MLSIVIGTAYLVAVWLEMGGERDRDALLIFAIVFRISRSYDGRRSSVHGPPGRSSSPVLGAEELARDCRLVEDRHCALLGCRRARLHHHDQRRTIGVVMQRHEAAGLISIVTEAQAATVAVQVFLGENRTDASSISGEATRQPSGEPERGFAPTVVGRASPLYCGHGKDREQAGDERGPCETRRGELNADLAMLLK